MKQLEGQDIDDLEMVELQPIDLGLPALKEIGAKWLVDMASYVSENPQFIVNGFIRSGITGALDALETDDMEKLEDEQEIDSDIDSDIVESEETDSEA